MQKTIPELCLYLLREVRLKGEQSPDQFCPGSGAYPDCLHAWNKIIKQKKSNNNLVREQTLIHSI